MAADGALVALARHGVPRAALPAAALQPRLRRVGEGALRPLDALATVQAGDHLGALGFGVGQGVALRRLPLAFEGGPPMNLIQAQLGHSSLATTSRYLAHIAPAELVKAMQARTWSL